MLPLPLLVFETNILMDVLLGRGAGEAELLVELAEQRSVALVVPEFALLEFRGTALRWVSKQLTQLEAARGLANEWMRSNDLAEAAEAIKLAADDIQTQIGSVRAKADELTDRIRSVAQVPAHTLDLHLRGDLRYLAGHPPDRPGSGIEDCRIFEAVLDIARANPEPGRQKFLVTRDDDFYGQEIAGELSSLGFQIRKDLGRLYGDLRQPRST